MLRFHKILFLTIACVGLAGSSNAFSLLGPSSGNPATAWQVPTWGYNLTGDIGGPMGISEEYRWNSPYLTYGFDPAFLNTYGSNGVAAVEQAIAIMNALPPASQMDLNAYPFRSQLFNPVAQALSLRDLKSHTLQFLMEEMGLAEPERYVWTLRHRGTTSNPDSTNYVVIQRNYDPETWDRTAYINGSLYTYASIFDNQQGDPPHTFPRVIPVNPLKRGNFASVAGFNLSPGGFYSGLTRDDAGGLRYLLATNNYNVETLLPDVEIISTNIQPIQLVTGDLAQLLKDTRNTTNTVNDVLALYTNLLITATNSYVGFEITTNIFTYFTNYPSAPVQVFETNYVTNVVTFFTYELGNVVTHFEYTNELGEFVITDAVYPTRPVLVRAVEVVPATDYQPGLPNIRTNYIGTNTLDLAAYTELVFVFSTNVDGSVITETRYYPANTNHIGQALDGQFYPYVRMDMTTNGEFYIVPPNLLHLTQPNDFTNAFYTQPVLGYSFLSNVVTTVTNTTNVDFFAHALLTIRTNTNTLQLLSTDWRDGQGADLATFIEQTQTNDPTALQALYPDLLILASNIYFTNIVTSNAVIVFTNSEYCPAGSLCLDFQWFFETNIATNFSYVFGNVVTNNSATCGPVIIEQSIVANKPFDPAWLEPTNITIAVTNACSNYLNGSVYIVPTNLFGYDRAFTQLVETVTITNSFVYTNFVNGIEQTNTFSFIRFATNYFYGVYPIEFVTTNDLASNVFGMRRETITWATNHVFAVQAIELLPGTNSTGLRPGVDKVNFVRVGFDSQLGTEFLRTTNYYFDIVIISNQAIRQLVRRASSRPDFIVSAGDINRAGNVPGASARTSTSGWINNSALNSTPGGDRPAGPGVITPQVDITFTTTTPFYFDFIEEFDYFISQPDLGQLVFGFEPLTYAWASFDGTTNAPIIYPIGKSITNLLNQVLNPSPAP